MRGHWWREKAGADDRRRTADDRGGNTDHEDHKDLRGFKSLAYDAAGMTLRLLIECGQSPTIKHPVPLVILHCVQNDKGDRVRYGLRS